MPRRKRTVRVHGVRASLNVPQLSKAGSSLELEIYADELKIGTLTIGRGSLYWRGGKRRSSKRISWSTFAERMDRLAYGE